MPVKHIRQFIMDRGGGALTVLLALGLVLRTQETAAAASESLALCTRVLIPSLFPFFVVSQLAIDTGLADACGRLLAGPMETLFRVPGSCAPALVLGVVGGYPVGAKTAIALYERGLCTRAQAQRLLSFCNNSGPAFILGAVGSLMGGTRVGLLLYGSHILASVTVGILLRKWGGDPPRHAALPPSVGRKPLLRAFFDAVADSFFSVLRICAFVIFFGVLIRLLCITGILPALGVLLGRLLGVSETLATQLLTGLIEVTGGVYGLVNSGAALPVRLAAAAFMLGWAGCSVHCQVLDFIGRSGLSCKPYLVGKALHGLFSALYVTLAARLLPFDLQVSVQLRQQLQSITSRPAGALFASALAAAVIAWALLTVRQLFHTCQSKRICYNKQRRG